MRPPLPPAPFCSPRRLVLNGLRQAGFAPFYIRQQEGAIYLKVQEGAHSLFSAYEVSYGNS